MKDPSGEVREFTITDEIQRTQKTNERVYFCLQRIRFDYGAVEYRLGYYIIGKKPSRKDKWVWGQYCPLIPKEDFEAILAEAIDKGWLGKF